MNLSINKINPYIRVAMHSVLPRDSFINKRVIFDYEIIYIEEGSLVLNYEGKDYTFNSGDFILLHPGVTHSFKRLKSNLSQPHIHFDIVYSRESHERTVSFKDIDVFSKEEKAIIHPDYLTSGSPIITFKDKESALKLFYMVIYETNPLIKKAKFIMLLEEIITDNFPNLLTSEKPAASVSAQIKDYIDAGLGLDYNLSDFEDMFSYSRFYIERQFKAEFNVSLIEYKNKVRLKIAKDMLKEKSVSYVSEELGFTSIYAFSRAYKNFYGYSPKNTKQSKYMHNKSR